MSGRPAIFRPKTKPVFPVAQHSERLQRVMRAHKDINFEYQLNHTKDRAEVVLSLYEQKYPNLVKSKLMTFCRVKIPEPNMFEIDDKGILDEKHEIKECLVWAESKKVMDPKNPLTNALCQASILHGVYSKPYLTGVFDEFENPTDKSKITKHINTFYIPFTKENVEKVLDQFNGKYRNTTICLANPGSDTWYQLPMLQIPSFQDWLIEPWDLLAKANKAGTLMEEAGGVQLYLKKQQEKKKQLEEEIAYFKKSGNKHSK